MHDMMEVRPIDGLFQFDYVLDLAKGTETQYIFIGYLGRGPLQMIHLLDNLEKMERFSCNAVGFFKVEPSLSYLKSSLII